VDHTETITGVTPAFLFATDDKYRLEITGTGITDSSVNTVDVLVGGIKQTTLSVTPQLIVVQIDDIPSSTTTLKIYLGIGIPNDGAIYNSVTFEPKLTDLTANQGSSAGGVIQAKIAGIGPSDNLMLVDGDNDDMCSSATVIRYGVLECHVKAKEYSNPTDVQVKFVG
jgi:hypothetical protein